MSDCLFVDRVMRIYCDTEFTTLDATSEPELISAGFAAEDGRELYGGSDSIHRELGAAVPGHLEHRAPHDTRMFWAG